MYCFCFEGKPAFFFFWCIHTASLIFSHNGNGMSSDERFFLLFVVVVVTRVVKRCKHFQLIYSPDHARMCTHHMVGVFFPRFPQLHYFSCFIRDFCLVVLINRPDAVDFGRFFFFLRLLPRTLILCLSWAHAALHLFDVMNRTAQKEESFFVRGGWKTLLQIPHRFQFFFFLFPSVMCCWLCYTRFRILF